MNDAMLIKKFASDACTVISGCQEFIGELKAELDAKDAQLKELSMNKSASAGFDADMLQKAASAVHAVYGSPANVSAEDIAKAWKSNPGYTIGVINKLASELLNRNAARASELGQPINKKASAVDAVSADEAFKQKYV
jgi:HPt (histidine-containing phosphotransfer) domain-containing protein